jgi:hypothetical protein
MGSVHAPHGVCVCVLGHVASVSPCKVKEAASIACIRRSRQ